MIFYIAKHFEACNSTQFYRNFLVIYQTRYIYSQFHLEKCFDEVHFYSMHTPLSASNFPTLIYGPLSGSRTRKFQERAGHFLFCLQSRRGDLQQAAQSSAERFFSSSSKYPPQFLISRLIKIALAILGFLIEEVHDTLFLASFFGEWFVRQEPSLVKKEHLDE